MNEVVYEINLKVVTTPLAAVIIVTVIMLVGLDSFWSWFAPSGQCEISKIKRIMNSFPFYET